MASLSGVSSSNSTSSLYNSANIISGLASGLDTEGMIESLVQSYQNKIESLNKKATKVEWKQDAYRSIIAKMNSFSSKYASYTSNTNLAAASFFNNSVNVATQGLFADRVSASGKTSSDITLDRVTQLATSAQYRTSSNLKSGDGVSIAAESGMSLNGTTELSRLNGRLTLTYGSQDVSISFDQVADVEALAEIKANNKYINEDEALAKLIEQKLADQKITFSGGNTESADKRIKVEARNGVLSFSDNSSAGNSVYISQASGNVEDVLGLDLENASKDQPNSFKLSGTMQRGLTYEEENAVYLSGAAMNLSLDGTTKQITLPQITGSKGAGYKIVDSDGKALDYTAENYTKVLNDAVQKAFKGSKINVENTATDGSLQLRFNIQEGSNLVINTDVGETLGIGRTATSYLNTSKTLEDLVELKDDYALRDKNGKFVLDEKGNKQYQFKINDTVVGTFTKDSKLSEVLSAINSNNSANMRVSYSQTTKNFLFSTKDTGVESSIEFGSGLAQAMFGSTGSASNNFASVYGLSLQDGESKRVSFQVGEDSLSFNVTNQDTMEDVAEKMNAVLQSFGNTASYNKTSGQLLVTDKTGNVTDFTVTADGNELEPKYTSSYTPGRDAVFTVTVNGETKNMVRSSNSVSIDGLTITMKDTFDGAKNEDGTPAVDSTGKAKNAVTFKTTVDSDKIVDAVKSMISDYNEMMAEIKSAYSTLPYQNSSGAFEDYEPLSEDDKAGMSESAIERYEAKAKQGILFGDRNLSNLYDKLRNVFTRTGEDGSMLTKMGIGSSYSTSDGTLTITFDESKFRSMLESDPDAVAQVFTKSTENGDSTNGIMQDMKAHLDTYGRLTGATKGILVETAGTPLSSLSLLNNTWQKELDRIADDIETWQDKLSAQVDRYTSQFSRLELLINQMNSQSATLAGLMGG